MLSPLASKNVARRAPAAAEAKGGATAPPPAPEPIVGDSPLSSTEQPIASPSDYVPRKKTSKRKAESTDAISTFLTRRFGIAGGLAWLGFLAVGSIGEQVKTRLEVASEESGTRDVQDAPEVVLPSGVRYRDLRVGGGSYPVRGYLTLLDYSATADGVPFESTRARGKPIVYLFGGRPFTGGMCAGLEEAILGMRAGGRRLVTVPPELGFGARGAVLRPTEHVPDKQGVVPPNATLEYDVELLRISIPPS
ncbi:Peptidyl-prolyl cis-trans isomerase FKBP17-2, chloroplastic [Tetrabaena socialis]|uniref:peptidylprolyl isomerase n=1 Tax=Tetrabaena socialis TaxID=47790 RepID=A0A2J7ZS97_9CHLO|nr:Peptidyl-prolyl cis-trans isomerase FKBP17-2, chloroplastic [Tetrabaena socialis]|eukprot:PNH03110.1 Peptidyl-prolyl cis-trans isomerase FKBP17-2, chloroplastic [Tetrabaena socialis]